MISSVSAQLLYYRDSGYSVVTEGVLTQNKGKIGRNGVTVPKYFYKTIYDPKGQGRMIGFLKQNNIIEVHQNIVIFKESNLIRLGLAKFSSYNP